MDKDKMMIAIAFVAIFGLVCLLYTTLSDDRVNNVKSNDVTNEIENPDTSNNNRNKLWLYSL